MSEHVTDVVSVLWFFGVWIGYTLIADSDRMQGKSILGLMHNHRSRWMAEMLRRDLRMVVAMILNHLQAGIALFASTSILAAGGLLAALAATEGAISALSALPLVGEMSRLEWEMRVLLLLLIAIYAFFKFVWSYRLYSICAVLIGGVPSSSAIDKEAEDQANRAAEILNLAARHFIRGLRAFYFALAALAWFIHPIALMASTVWVVAVLYRRDFRSRSLQIVRGNT